MSCDDALHGRYAHYRSATCAGVIGLKAQAEARTITSGHRLCVKSDTSAEACSRIGRCAEQTSMFS